MLGLMPRIANFEQILFFSNPPRRHGYLISKGLHDAYGIPELLAVNVQVQGEAWFHVRQGMYRIMAELVGQGVRYCRNETIIRLAPAGVAQDATMNAYIDQVALVLVTDPAQVKNLAQKYFPDRSDMMHILLLMPLCQGHYWGHVPPAPEGKVVLRNCIKAKFERQKLGLAGFVRMLDGNFHNCTADNLRLVSLDEALAHPEWCIHWDMALDAEEAAYLKKYQKSHFANLCLGGFGRRMSGKEYIAKVCAVPDPYGGDNEKEQSAHKTKVRGG